MPVFSLTYFTQVEYFRVHIFFVQCFLRDFPVLEYRTLVSVSSGGFIFRLSLIGMFIVGVLCAYRKFLLESFTVHVPAFSVDTGQYLLYYFSSWNIVSAVLFSVVSMFHGWNARELMVFSRNILLTFYSAETIAFHYSFNML